MNDAIADAMPSGRTMLSDAELASFGLPPRPEWSREDFDAFLAGWSHQRLGYPAPPPKRDMRRARSISELAHSVAVLVGNALGSKLLPAGVRRAAFFRAGAHESVHAAAAA